ncbi:hypothetical protein [Microbacterium sulfonylureivorans]|uniref:hypothetical protein n=1 Tax=Microbacterium sulfonylureivorans TaxID=2486854 RepID=UPI001F0C4F57|nr:hypothetical protein [Microbacterium sulfonylureivorans]
MSDPAEPTPPQTPPQQSAPPSDSAVPAVPQAPAAWAAPGAPPFGAPVAHDPAAGYAPPAGYAIPPGYAAQPTGPTAAASSAAPYAPPDYGQGYAPAPGPYAAGPASVRPASAGGRRLGVVALVVALVATVGAAISVAIAAFSIGLGAGREIAMRPIDADFDWSYLSAVREWVLLAEVTFWLGTALGLWALVQGVIALVKGRGRGAAIAAIVVAALGPVVFFVVLQGFLTAGMAAGSSVGG